MKKPQARQAAEKFVAGNTGGYRRAVIEEIECHFEVIIIYFDYSHIEDECKIFEFDPPRQSPPDQAPVKVWHDARHCWLMRVCSGTLTAKGECNCYIDGRFSGEVASWEKWELIK